MSTASVFTNDASSGQGTEICPKVGDGQIRLCLLQDVISSFSFSSFHRPGSVDLGVWVLKGVGVVFLLSALFFSYGHNFVSDKSKEGL